MMIKFFFEYDIFISWTFFKEKHEESLFLKTNLKIGL